MFRGGSVFSVPVQPSTDWNEAHPYQGEQSALLKSINLNVKLTQNHLRAFLVMRFTDPRLQRSLPSLETNKKIFRSGYLSSEPLIPQHKLTRDQSENQIEV